MQVTLQETRFLAIDGAAAPANHHASRIQLSTTN